MILKNKHWITIIALLCFCSGTSDNLCALNTQHESSVNQTLPNSVDSIVLNCRLFPIDRYFNILIYSCYAKIQFRTTDSCSTYLDDIDRNRLLSYVDVFFISNKEKVYYKTSHEANNKYIMTDYPSITVMVYKQGKAIVSKRIPIATNLWRESGDTIVMYHDCKTYHYNRKFVDFCNFIETLAYLCHT